MISSITAHATKLFGIIVMTCLCLPVQGQTVVPRDNFGALLEPADALMHGAGQSVEDFDDYWHAMPEERKPGVYMHYIGLSSLGPDWADDLKKTLLTYPDHFVIPQIGLSMTSDGNPNAHYEDRVAAGEFDQQIDSLIEGFRHLAFPAYLRIGYEFNGVVWNGYQPESYKAAFIYLTEKLRAADLEVAMVWCAAMDGARNFFDYYPGDAYVDWFGLDLFSAEHFSDNDAYAFLDSARVHRKPVMIGETTPRRIGVTDGEADWNAWFVPFFDYMNSRTEIKQFGYINWNWIEWSTRLGINWFDWGDARLQTNAAVLGRYVEAIAPPEYLHATSEHTFRQRLGYTDSTPPPTVMNLKRSEDTTQVTLTWNAVTDPSGLARYIIYKDGEVSDYTVTPSYTEPGGAVGTSTYSVSAMDRAGNESPRSSSVTVSILRKEHIQNGGFEDEREGWHFDFFNNLARATFTSETNAPLQGAASGLISVQRSPGTDWHIQLRQFMTLTAGNTYQVTLQARAGEAVTVPLMFQQNADPFTIYHRRDLSLGTDPQTISFSITPSVTDEIAFTFFLGAIGTSDIWLDGVSVVELTPSAVHTETLPLPPTFELTIYPSPATSTSTIAYEIGVAGHSRLEVYDVLGRRVRVLYQGWQEAGSHQVQAAFEGFADGLYLVRLTSPGGQASRPIAILD